MVYMEEKQSDNLTSANALQKSAEIKANEVPMVEMKDNPQEKSTLWKGIFFIVLSAFCYSLMSLFVRKAGNLPTFQKSFFRNLVASFVGLILLIKSKSFAIKQGNLPALFGRSIAGSIGVLCNFYAIDNMNMADASILNKLAPFASVVFSIFLLKEKASRKDWLFVFIAFIGAVFVVKPSFHLSDSAPALLGAFGGINAGLAYTFVRFLGKRGERPAVIVFFFSTFSCIVMFPLFLTSYQPMTFAQVGFLLLAGCAASGAQYTVTLAYKYAPAKEISVYDYSQVLFTALWGIVFLSEFPDYISIIGYAIIIGAAIAKYLFSRKSQK